jgi:hypothetical protein
MRSVVLGLVLGVAVGLLTEALTWTATPDDEAEPAPVTTIVGAADPTARG